MRPARYVQTKVAAADAVSSAWSIGGGHLHAVHAHEGQVGPFLHEGHQLGGAQTGGLRGAGARGERGVQAVDVQAQVHGRVAMLRQPVTNAGQHWSKLLRALQASQIAGREDLPALAGDVFPGLASGGRADADLREARRIDQALRQGLGHPGAVPAGLAEVVRPGVAMRVHVDHRQGAPQPLAVGLQQGQSDRVIASQPHHVVLPDQAPNRLCHGLAHGLQAGVGQGEVPGISQVRGRRHVEVRVGGVAQHVAGQADGPRPEPRTGPVGDGTVPRQAGHRKRPVRARVGREQKPRVGEVGK